MARNKRTTLRWFLILVILQSILSICAIVRIPIDPKNLTGLGLTRGRLALIALIIMLDMLGSICLIYYEAIMRYLRTHVGVRRLYRILQTTALILAAVFWVSLWLPKYRLDTLAEEYERTRPFLLWLGAAGLELFAVLRIFSTEGESRIPEKIKKQNGKPFLSISLITAVVVFIYLYLKANIPFDSGIIEPASAPVTPLQLFVLWLLMVVFYRVQQKTAFISRPIFIAICAVLLYLLSCAMFLSAPITCKGDMIGIYPPNFTCYPDIHDAVYNIGSLYIHYGEGIYNQWFTDKPLYMLFLAACQWIGGLQIQGYMAVQVIFLSALPVLIFLFVRRLAGLPGAPLAALLVIFHQENAILLYSKLGGVNIRIAATEIFTGILLVCTAWFLNKWFRKPAKPLFPLATGVFLGLAILTRFNAVLIVPVVLAACVFYYWKAKGLGLRKLAVFGAGLVMVLSPWFLVYPAVNPGLENPYYEKIQNIFVDRAANPSAPKVMEKPAAQILVDDEQLDKLRLEALNVEGIPASVESKAGQSLAQQVLFHFTNNIFTAFFSLPVNSSFLDGDTLTEQSFWEQNNQVIWQKGISAENLALWGLTVALFILGIGQSWRRWGVSGLAPLLVLAGYLLGVSFALTSGGRYIEPIMWVVFSYYAIGLTRLTVWALQAAGLGGTIKSQTHPRLESRCDRFFHVLRSWAENPLPPFIGLVLLVLTAAALPFLQYLPDQLPPEEMAETEQLAYEYLQDEVKKADWEAFLRDEGSVVVEGVLYFPQYYSQSRFSLARGTDVFEALVLSRDYAYMSYMWNWIPLHITDGSRVILVGCVLKEGYQWGMQRRITQTYALIQLDNERYTYVDDQAGWACP